MTTPSQSIRPWGAQVHESEENSRRVPQTPNDSFAVPEVPPTPTTRTHDPENTFLASLNVGRSTYATLNDADASSGRNWSEVLQGPSSADGGLSRMRASSSHEQRSKRRRRMLMLGAAVAVVLVVGLATGISIPLVSKRNADAAAANVENGMMEVARQAAFNELAPKKSPTAAAVGAQDAQITVAAPPPPPSTTTTTQTTTTTMRTTTTTTPPPPPPPAYNGRLTFYYPNGGEGFCWTLGGISNQDRVIALTYTMMSQDWCGVQVCISYAPTGMSTTAIIKDECPDAICSWGHMDTTPAVWDALGIPLSVGLVTSGVSWWRC
ncbi:hypothetical protein M427DRAFT_55074 [Gonapodya prolifera JEL478]|uniref:RlpA-like protein double-psi beta-barrel domain-containing protein n=1 Tax=Gonapodya prolifera (strain JEL478) TaxID=1344416 RepID=A0A139AK36_GONPJ|nr:hypothetical protein M427DRAFT_55074 [Gonapodya prolifera JEL478]|eukprot:KXS17068.1 hypothetical protein M427DRAFT_55074 [Gonapodya prolifera JEL478]